MEDKKNKREEKKQGEMNFSQFYTSLDYNTPIWSL